MSFAAIGIGYINPIEMQLKAAYLCPSFRGKVSRSRRFLARGSNKTARILAGSGDFRYKQNDARGLKSRGRLAFQPRRPGRANRSAASHELCGPATSGLRRKAATA